MFIPLNKCSLQQCHVKYFCPRKKTPIITIIGIYQSKSPEVLCLFLSVCNILLWEIIKYKWEVAIRKSTSTFFILMHTLSQHTHSSWPFEFTITVIERHIHLVHYLLQTATFKFNKLCWDWAPGSTEVGQDVWNLIFSNTDRRLTAIS